MLRFLDSDGRGSYIVPNSWLTIESAKLLRARVAPLIHSVLDLNYSVFQGVSMEPSIFVTEGQPSERPVSVARVSTKEGFVTATTHDLDRHRWTHGDGRFTFTANNAAADVVRQSSSAAATIGAVFDARTGLQAYERGKGNPPQSASDVKNHVFDRDKRQDSASFRYLQGGDVCRYQLKWSGMWMQYGPWLAQPREFSMFTRPRVLLREITAPFPRCLHAVFTDEAFLSNKSVLTVLHSNDDREALFALVGILNSKFTSHYYKQAAVKSSRRIFPKVVTKNLREFPFPKDPKATNTHTYKTLGSLTQTATELHGQLPLARTAHSAKVIERQIAATDRKIDQLVYELYGLTDDDIRVVEEATA